jgi:CBS domain-containing protein
MLRVRDVMNPLLVHVTAVEPVGDVIAQLLGLGITGAPVLDEEHRPLGFVSLRDCVAAEAGAIVAERMSAPAITVSVDDMLTAAGRLLGERGLHHAVVVGEDGTAVGMLSALDVLRALVGLKPSHPPAFRE